MASGLEHTVPGHGPAPRARGEVEDPCRMSAESSAPRPARGQGWDMTT